MTPTHATVSVATVSTLTLDELADYRDSCRTYIRHAGPTGWAYVREVALLLSINRRLDWLGS